MWSLPLKICVIIFLVYSQLGISAALGSMLGTFITIPCQFLVGKAMSRNNRNIMESEDKRLQASTEALQNMKTLKLNCWEDILLNRINEHRNKELKLLAKDSFFLVRYGFFRKHINTASDNNNNWYLYWCRREHIFCRRAVHSPSPV